MRVDYEDTEDDMMEDLQVTLEIEGKSIETKPITIFELDDQDYIMLGTVDEDGDFPEDAELYLFRYEEDEDGEPSISDIDDEDEYKRVSERAEEILNDMPIEE